MRERKLCPLPVASFTGRRDILDKMQTYFDADSESQRIFVLYGLGGTGKSQLAFKFIDESQKAKRYCVVNDITTSEMLTNPVFSFSDIFYVDATNEQTIQTDLEALIPGNAERSVDAGLRWLAKQPNGNWLIYFDNADDVNLKLKKFFPRSESGNILVTTRNPELRHYTGRDADANVTGMGHEDATTLLLRQAQAEGSDENKALAEEIVQVLSWSLPHCLRV